LSHEYEKEKILVVPTNDLLKILNFKEGLIKVELEDIKTLIREKGSFEDRNLVETDERFRQVIPYVVLKSNDKYLVVKRLETQGEKRLHNKYSIGIGGHVNIEDLNEKDMWKAVENGLKRELMEEVNVTPKGEFEFLGVINDVSSSVSRVHFGLCYILECQFHGINEKDKFEEMWLEESELSDKIDKMEGWSKIVVEYLLKSKTSP
jgi:predicted NUDIX family phosphoesterase